MIALLCVVLLYATALAEEEVSDRGKTALGVSLPSPQKGISVWRVSPNAIWGLEVDYSLAERAWRQSTDNSTLTIVSVRPSLVFKQLRPMRRDVAPFLYQAIYTGIHYMKTSPEAGDTNWDVGATLGVGAMWFPVKQVSLVVRQGVTLEFQEQPPRFRDDAASLFEGEKRMRLYTGTTALYALVQF